VNNGTCKCHYTKESIQFSIKFYLIFNLFLKDFKCTLNSLREVGIEEFWKKWVNINENFFFDKSIIKNSTELFYNGNVYIRLKNLKSIFIICIVLLSISFVVFIFELRRKILLYIKMAYKNTVKIWLYIKHIKFNCCFIK
jgi:hypothetical protein